MSPRTMKVILLVLFFTGVWCNSPENAEQEYRTALKAKKPLFPKATIINKDVNPRIRVSVFRCNKADVIFSPDAGSCSILSTSEGKFSISSFGFHFEEKGIFLQIDLMSNTYKPPIPQIIARVFRMSEWKKSGMQAIPIEPFRSEQVEILKKSKDSLYFNTEELNTSWLFDYLQEDFPLVNEVFLKNGSGYRKYIGPPVFMDDQILQTLESMPDGHKWEKGLCFTLGKYGFSGRLTSGESQRK